MYFKHSKLASLLLVVIVCVSGCTASKKTTSSTIDKVSVTTTLTYARDIKPMMVEKCSPCHFPKTGKKKLLNTYSATKENIGHILERVQLDPSDLSFMPYRGKNPALTTEEIQTLSEWATGGMPE